MHSGWLFVDVGVGVKGIAVEELLAPSGLCCESLEIGGEDLVKRAKDRVSLHDFSLQS